MIHVSCPYCQRHIPVAENWSGMLVCPGCQRQVAINAAAPQPPPQSATAPGPPVAGVAATGAVEHSGRVMRRRRRNNEAVLLFAIAGAGLAIVMILMVALLTTRKAKRDGLVQDSIAQDYAEAADSDRNERTGKSDKTDPRGTGNSTKKPKKRTRPIPDVPADQGPETPSSGEDPHVQPGVDVGTSGEDAHLQTGVDVLPSGSGGFGRGGFGRGGSNGLGDGELVNGFDGVGGGDGQPSDDSQPSGDVQPSNDSQSGEGVLNTAMAAWGSGVPHPAYMGTASSVASFELPEWREKDYELDTYSVVPQKEFQSPDESRFWVTMSFRDQDAADVRRLLSVSSGEDGRWVVRTIE